VTRGGIGLDEHPDRTGVQGSLSPPPFAGVVARAAPLAASAPPSRSSSEPAFDGDLVGLVVVSDVLDHRAVFDAEHALIASRIAPVAPLR
jgi:hypothetical protein